MRVAPGSCKSPPRAVSPVSEKAVAAASVVTSVLTAAAAFTVGGCREGTVTTVGAHSCGGGFLDQEIRAGTGDWRRGRCAANQRPPRAPVSSRRTRGSSQAREQSGWQRRPATAACSSHPHANSHTPRRRHLPAGAYKRSASRGGGLKPPRPPPTSPLTTPPPAPSSLLTPRSSRRQCGFSETPLRSLLSSPLSAPRTPLPFSPPLPSALLRACIIFCGLARLPLQPGEVGRRVG